MPAPVRLAVMSARLQAWPIPKGQVLAGSPRARGRLLHDGTGETGVWECSPGRFTWRYDTNQAMTILSGRATLALGRGRSLSLKAGDAVFIPRGTRATWTVKATVRKVYTLC